MHALLFALSLALQSPPPKNADAVRFAAFRAQIDAIESPAAADVDAAGNVWVAESFAHQVRAFAPEGRELVRFGGFGSKPGELVEPSGIALAPDGRVFVSDTGNDRIAVFDARGEFLSTFGARGPQPGELGEPLGLTIANGTLYVAEALNDRVQAFTLDGKALATFGTRGRGTGELLNPRDVAVDAQGNVFVADTANQRVAKFAPDGTHVKSWGGHGVYPGLFAHPSGIEVRESTLYVADRDNHRVQLFDLDGKVLGEWGLHALLPREGNGKLHYPSGIALAPSGDFALVVETFEDRVQLFARELEPPPVGTPPERNTAAHYAGGIAQKGKVLAVLEPSGPSVSIFDVAGASPIEITRFGSSGAKYGEFVELEGVALDEAGEHVYVSDPALSRISMFRIARAPDAELAYDPFLAKFVRSIDVSALDRKATWPIEPGALALAPNGDLYVADRANGRVVVLDCEWKLVRTVGEHGLGEQRLSRPSGIAFREDQGGGTSAVVTDSRSGRAYLFTVARSGAIELGRMSGLCGDGLASAAVGRPYGVAFDPLGRPIVTDERLTCVAAVHENVAAKRGLGALEFNKPQGICVGTDGRVYVVDAGNHRFQILSKDLEYLGVFGARLYMLPAMQKK